MKKKKKRLFLKQTIEGGDKKYANIFKKMEKLWIVRWSVFISFFK